MAVSGTPMGTNDTPTIWDMGRMIATARIVMPRSMVRLSAGELGPCLPLEHGHELIIVGLTLESLSVLVGYAVGSPHDAWMCDLLVVWTHTGRLSFTPGEQALLFLAGANSIFNGDKLLTTPNPEFDEDKVGI